MKSLLLIILGAHLLASFTVCCKTDANQNYKISNSKALESQRYLARSSYSYSGSRSSYGGYYGSSYYGGGTRTPTIPREIKKMG